MTFLTPPEKIPKIDHLEALAQSVFHFRFLEPKILCFWDRFSVRLDHALVRDLFCLVEDHERVASVTPVVGESRGIVFGFMIEAGEKAILVNTGVARDRV